MQVLLDEGSVCQQDPFKFLPMVGLKVDLRPRLHLLLQVVIDFGSVFSESRIFPV